MATRFYTVLILPDATSPARTFQVTRTILTAVSSVAAVSLLTFAFFLYQAVTLNGPLRELQQLRQEARDRNVLAAKVGQLEGELTRLGDLDRQLRREAGLDAGANQEANLAQGGSDISSQAALREARQKGTGPRADGVGQALEALGQEITSRAQGFRELTALLEAKRAALAATPSIWPARGLMTSGYGYRASPFTGEREMHEGLDIAAPLGTPIKATADGVVAFVGPRGNYGNAVFINHGHGVVTVYAHTSTIRVKEGQPVKRGDLIADIGSTGRSTGPHVLYEVRVDGVAVNPLKYIVNPTEVKFAHPGAAGGPS
jgi:murein DD-endopeptidase MepM/ murein hydrolase activator NlpD